jgi:hypothetical protein
MLICFVPLTLLCLAVISASVVGDMPTRDGLLYLSAAAIGPIGLIVGFKMIVLRHTTLGGAAIAVLCIPAAWTVLGFLLLVLGGDATVNEWWREFVLIALLPAIGSAHLIFIASRSANKLTAS